MRDLANGAFGGFSGGGGMNKMQQWQIKSSLHCQATDLKSTMKQVSIFKNFNPTNVRCTHLRTKIKFVMILMKHD